MKINSLLVAAVLLLGMAGFASAQSQSTQERKNAPTEFQNSTPNKPAIATVPEAATDTPGVPSPQTTGEAPNVSKKMGAEMDSAGDPKASPDGE
jgi:hypothetical protein